MPLIFSLLLRLVLLVAGLVFAASLAVVFVLLLSWWALRALWAGVTGRPVMPFAMRMGPRGAFEEMMRRAAQPASRTPRADAARAPGRIGDVTDVEPK